VVLLLWTSRFANGRMFSHRLDHSDDLSNAARLRRRPAFDVNESISACVNELFAEPLPSPQKRPRLGHEVDGLYVVHSPIAPERKTRLMGLLGDHNASATWVEVLEASDIGKTVQACAFDSEYPGRYMKDDDFDRWKRIASAVLKHYRIFYDVVRLNQRYAIVMEDDSVLPDDWDIALRFLMHTELPRLEEQNLPPAEFVQLSGCLDFLEFNATNPKFTIGDKVTKHLWGPGYGQRCMSGYLISQAGARRMLKVLSPDGKKISDCVDNMLDLVAKNDTAIGGYWYETRLWPQDQYEGTFHLNQPKEDVSDALR